MNLELVFDGGNGGSVEKNAYGSFQCRVDDTIQDIQRVSFGVGYTNNEAEYMTLIAALQHILKIYDEDDIDLAIQGDSELIRNQIGTIVDKATFNNKPSTVIWLDVWRVKKLHLLPLRNKARELLEQFTSFTYTHIPRDEVVQILGH